MIQNAEQQRGYLKKISTKKIPVTIITGFLGSGKTTLMENILQNCQEKKIALIINEFGDFGVDGEVLKKCALKNCPKNTQGNDAINIEENIIELNNGCICCTVADDFIPVMTKLLDRPQPLDHILIETSGLALPQPLIAAFNWPEIKTQTSVDSVIAVIDAYAISENRFAFDEDLVAKQREESKNLDHETALEELFADQITAADIIILNKIDLLKASQADKVKETILKYRKTPVQIMKASFGNLPIDLLLGLGFETQQDIENRPALHYDPEEDHHHNNFISFVVRNGSVENVEKFKRLLSELSLAHNILRIKGFVFVKDKPMRFVIQGVATRIEGYFDEPWPKGVKKETCLVFILDHRADKQAILKALSA